MMITRCIAVGDARRTVHLDVLLTIAAAFGLGRALDSSGAAAAIGDALIHMTGQSSPIIGLALVYALTIALSIFVTSKAAAVLVFPVAMVMALPGVACHYLFRAVVRNDSEGIVFGGGFAAGATGILLGALLGGGALLAAGQQFESFGYLFVIANLPLALVKGLVTGSVVVLLRKVRPELLEAPLSAPAAGSFS